MNNTTRDRLEAAAREAESSLNARGRYASTSIDNLAHRWHEDAEPVVDDLADRAVDMARQSARWVRDGSGRLGLQVSRASDRARDGVRNEPVRSLLMALAAGALLYAVARVLVAGSRTHPSMLSQ